MRLTYLTSICAILALVYFSPFSDGKAAVKDQSASGVELPDGYRAASFSCW